MKKWFLAIAVGFTALMLGLVIWNETRKPQPVVLVPTLTGEPEYCLTCHQGLRQISPSHPVATYGCVICHGGQALAVDADQAHSTMRGGRNPSDLSVVQASCGGSNCHSGTTADLKDHIQRVTTSVQATYSGAIATVLYAFGTQPDSFAHQAVFAVQDPQTKSGITALSAFDPSTTTSPAIQSFATNCLYCHISAEPLPKPAFARLTGCAACHTLTAGTDLKQTLHQLTTAIPYTQCNTCHNRGNYSMRDLQFHERTDAPQDRLHNYYQPIGQCTLCEYELDCVDCHTNGEAMGNGDLHNNQAEVQYVQCQTCHGTQAGPPLTKTITDPNDLALRLASLNPVLDLKLGDTIVVTTQGEPLWNLRQLKDGTFEMVAKTTGVRYPVPLVAGSACKQKADEQASQYCHACHAVQR
jgi:hypothetical protein